MSTLRRLASASEPVGVTHMQSALSRGMAVKGSSGDAGACGGSVVGWSVGECGNY